MTVLSLLVGFLCTAPRALIVDIDFPSPFGAWRQLEIKHWIVHYDTDILSVHLTNVYKYFGKGSYDAGVRHRINTTSAAWPALNESHQLHCYDIYIFDIRFNHLQQFNEPGFDGTRFNGHVRGADYLLRRKTARHRPLDHKIHTDEYAVIYHIFCMVFLHFAHFWPSVSGYSKHVVKLYPGGGMADRGVKCSSACRTKTCLGRLTLLRPHIISTQAHIRDCVNSCRVLRDRKREHAFVLGVPVAEELPPVPQRLPPAHPLGVVFTADRGSSPHAKGLFLYFQLIDAFWAAHPQLNGHVHFFGVGGGVTESHSGMIRLAQMTQSELNTFYRRTPISIYVNLDRFSPANGWPLGMEALYASGALLFSTDDFDLNRRNGFNFGPECTIVNSSNLSSAVARLHAYATNYTLLHTHALRMRRALARSSHCCQAPAHMARIFDVIDRVACTHGPPCHARITLLPPHANITVS